MITTGSTLPRWTARTLTSSTTCKPPEHALVTLCNCSCRALLVSRHCGPLPYSARCCCCRCYFDATADSDVSRWNESISMLLDQGYPPSTINIAIPYCAPPLAPYAARPAVRVPTARRGSVRVQTRPPARRGRTSAMSARIWRRTTTAALGTRSSVRPTSARAVGKGEAAPQDCAAASSEGGTEPTALPQTATDLCGVPQANG